ncbi:MAG TPA: cyanophycin synthetase, partial [Limnobacter sp.]|nr:cyanophycin synthetase [Limnobacter sp.]
SFLPQDGRGNRLPVVVNGQAVTLINESYNANPLSMRAALDALATCSEAHQRVLVLGDMLELGDLSASAHLELAGVLKTFACRKILLIGTAMKSVKTQLHAVGEDCEWFPDLDSLAAELSRVARKNDQVLIKASNGIGLQELIRRFKGN